MRAVPQTPSGRASGPAPNSADEPSGMSTCRRPRPIRENAERTAERKAEGLSAREPNAEESKNLGSESMVRQGRGAGSIDSCGR